MQLNVFARNSNQVDKELKMYEAEKKGRPHRYDADFFQHHCHNNQVLEIIISKYQSTGYAFYYRLQELLGKTPGHGYNANSNLKYEYLLSKTGVNVEECDEIIAFLCDFDELNAEEWANNKIIWWQSFVDGFTDLYKKRRTIIPPDLEEFKRIDKDGDKYHLRVYKDA